MAQAALRQEKRNPGLFTAFESLSDLTAVRVAVEVGGSVGITAQP